MNYRIGSLENRQASDERISFVNYRIGNLEIFSDGIFNFPRVNYRIGSLESKTLYSVPPYM